MGGGGISGVGAGPDMIPEPELKQLLFHQLRSLGLKALCVLMEQPDEIVINKLYDMEGKLVPVQKWENHNVAINA